LKQIRYAGNMYAEPEIFSENDSPREKARKHSREIIKERNDTTGGSRKSYKREHLIIKWILRITHMNKDGEVDFSDWVQDGKVLSNVMTTLCFNSIEIDPYAKKKKKSLTADELSRHRIREIIDQIRDYGVEDKYIFTVEDVLEKKRPNKIIRCLEEVAKLAKKDQDGPKIKLDTLLRNKLYT